MCFSGCNREAVTNFAVVPSQILGTTLADTPPTGMTLIFWDTFATPIVVNCEIIACRCNCVATITRSMSLKLSNMILIIIIPKWMSAIPCDKMLCMNNSDNFQRCTLLFHTNQRLFIFCSSVNHINIILKSTLQL